ncbi:hypothetical protein IMCC3317_34390 [Kordia antarctica]|uniref:Peptidase C14 caspase domain-containing protein n=1 Tax=Kordia antarctica TaxID=1218801 RepID=A0A7L4ZN69_9FLAO|nr:caspase family protein [Kordia antarctica]QHI38055.1 hypothetical protein IMCC3317_34390 [Kordia antarctica]
MVTTRFYILIIINFIFICKVSSQQHNYESIKKDSLLQISWNSFSAEERKNIRYYLKTTYPESVEGIFSKAYLESVNDRKEEAISLYRQALKKEPNHLYSLLNLAIEVNYPESKMLIERVIEKDSSFSNYIALIRKFSLLYENESAEIVEDYIDTLTKQLSHTYLPLYLQGIYYMNKENYELANNSFEKALKIAPYNTYVIRNYVDVGINKLTNSNTPSEERLAYLNFILGEGKFKDLEKKLTKRELAEILHIVAEKLLLLRFNSDAFNIFNYSFYFYPTIESLKGAIKSSIPSKTKDLENLLNRAINLFDNNQALENILALRSLEYNFNLKKSKQHYLNSIQYSKTLKDSLNNTIQLALQYYILEPNDYSKASEILNSFKESKKNLNDTELYNIALNLHAVEFLNTNFEKALIHLNQANSFNTLKSSYYEERYKELKKLVNDITEKQVENEVLIVPTTVLETNNSMAISPNNKYIALGVRPTQLWDLEKKIKLRDIGIGGISSKFSLNNKYLAVIVNNKLSDEWTSSMIVIHNILNGDIEHIIPASHEREVSDFDWSPDSKKITYLTNNGEIYVYDLSLKKRIVSSRAGNILIGGSLLWHKSGKWIISGQAQSKYLTIHNSLDLSSIKRLNQVDWPHALGQTYDGKYLVCSDNNSNLTTWDIENEWSFYNKVNINQAAKTITAHPNKPIIAVNAFNKKGNYPLITFDVEKQKKLNSTTSVISAPKIYFSSNGEKIFKIENSKIDILSSETLTVNDSIIGESSYAYLGSTDKKNDYYITVDAEGVKIWNILNGRKVYTWNKKPDYFYKIESGEGDKYLAAFHDYNNRKTKVYIYNSSNISKSLVLQLDFKLDKIKESKDKYVFAGSYFKVSKNDNVKQGEIALVNKSDFKFINKYPDISLIEDILKYQGGIVPFAGFHTIDITENGKELIYATYWQDGTGHELSYSKKCRVIDLSQKLYLIIKTIKTDREIKQASYVGKNDSVIKISEGTQNKTFDRKRFESLSYDSNSLYEVSINLKNGDILKYSSNAISIERKNGTKDFIRYPYSNLIDLEVFEEKNLFISLTNLNQIEFFDLNKFAKRLTIIPKKNNEYFSYTPNGQYLSSNKFGNKVIWLSNNRFLELETLPENYNENLIKNQLSSIYSGKEFDLPVRYISKHNIPPNASYSLIKESHLFENYNYDFDFKIVKNNSRNKDPEIELFLNDELVKNHLIDKKILGDTIFYKAKLKLRKNNNSIRVMEKFNDLTLQRIYHKLYSNVVAEKQDRLPRLVILGIGISKYKDSSRNLDYAHKDIKDITNIFLKQRNVLFSEIKVDTLINNNATRDNIVGKIDEIQDYLKDSDVLLIYYAGHGELINEKLCLMPWGTDFKNKKRRYNISEFLDIGAIRRSDDANTIIMLDMCNAGNIKNEVFNNQKLNSNAKVTVFASSIGVQSFEDEDFGDGGNGAFTAAIISGLEGQADQLLNVGDENYEVDIFELSVFLKIKIEQLTNSIQVPYMTTTKDSGGSFVIFKNKKE